MTYFLSFFTRALQVAFMIYVGYPINFTSPNKSTASIIPRHSYYLLFIKVIVAKMSGKKMTEGQITILNKILIISMHIQ